MNRKRPRTGRWTGVAVLAAASALTLTGVAQAGPAPSPGPASSPSTAPSPGPAPSAPAGQSHPSARPPRPGQPGATCTVTPAGHLAGCQRAVATDKLPAGAKNTAAVNQPVADLASLVDTRTWTTGGGNTFPGAEVPFGMVQWSPDTMPNRNAGGGYSYTDTSLTGYSLDHISGPGCGAAGDVPILPVTSALPSGTDPNAVTTPFTHTGETAQAGYYEARSNGDTDPVMSEFTATKHSSMGRFTFPQGSDAGFDIKLQGSQTDVTADTATIVGSDEVRGSVTTGDFCGESVNDGQSQQYTVYFDLKFSQPFASSQVITATSGGSPEAVYVSFDTSSDPVVQAKVGLSYVSAANARANWQSENPGWNFGAVKAAAQSTWNSLLGEISVAGGSYAKTQQFYSMLYKDFIQPNVTSDVSGQFMGSDEKIHTLASGQHDQYGIYSGWDIYHTTAQLQAMLDPAAASDQAQSQDNYYSEDGVFQQWGYLQANNYVMVGDPEASIISDYYAFGARNFHTRQTLADLVKEATTVNDARPGEALESKYGYLPQDGTYGCCNFHGVVATQLEDDIADFALSNLAKSLGDTRDASMLQARANDWENTFNPVNGLLNARYENGQFEPGITKTTQQANEPDYVEGDAYEYLWEVPQDYPTLFSLLGGKAKAAAALRDYLSKPNGSGVYAEIANEFDLGEQYAPYYAGDPAGAQQAIHTIETTVYQPGPSGLDNNDDLGAMSATDVWQLLGLYPENPGSDTLLLSTPGFDHERITLPAGKTITINAPHSQTEYYPQLLKIDGTPHQKLSTTYGTLSHGATLDWTLSPTPTTWGTAPQDAPPSDTSGTTATVGYLAHQTVTVGPGGSATLTAGADNATDAPQKVAVSVQAPAGVTITPATATITVPPHATATTALTATAAAGTTQNFYSAPVTETTASTGHAETLNQTILVAAPHSLLSTYNNAGIASDSDPGAGNFDGEGYSYSAQALAADGFRPGQDVTVNGVTFTWPLPGDGFPDNTVPDGQTIDVSAPSGTRTLAFLAAATNGPVPAEPLTLHYSDGSASTYWLRLSDWTLNAGSSTPSYGNTVAATTSYRNCPGCTGGQDKVATDVFYTDFPVDPGKTLTSVTLPAAGAASSEHIFSVGTGASAPAGPVIGSLSATSAKAGDQVTINGSGFGESRGNGYVAFGDNGVDWGSPGDAALTVDSWSDTAITFTVPLPGGSGGQDQVWPGTPSSVSVTGDSTGGTGGHTSAATILPIAPTANAADYYDNAGVSDDSGSSCADFDGDGYSYSAQALAAAGLTPGGAVTADGLTYTWPDAAVCASDNILAAGQTMLVNGTAGATRLGLLESSTNGGTSGTLTVTYTDGTSATATLDSSDWAGGPGPAETAVATMPYRNAGGSSTQQITMYVYATQIPLDSSKTVASVTFPDVSPLVSQNSSAMHIFAVADG